MKLCIVRSDDDNVAEILLRDRQPSFEAFNNEQLFFENYQYKFILREIEEYENVEIFVGDYFQYLYIMKHLWIGMKRIKI